MWIDREEVDELVQVYHFRRFGFCGLYIFLIEDQIIMPFQPVAVCYLALGDLISFLAEDLAGDGSFAFLMQHSEADLFLDGERDSSYRDIDQSNADAA